MRSPCHLPGRAAGLMILPTEPTFKFTKIKSCPPPSCLAKNSNFFKALIINRYIALFYWDFYSIYFAINYVFLFYRPITLYSCVLARNTWLVSSLLKIRLFSWPACLKTSCSDLLFLCLPSEIALKQLSGLLLMQEDFTITCDVTALFALPNRE